MSALVTMLILWALNVFVDTGGQLAFKRAALHTREASDAGLGRWKARAREPWIWAGVACFVAEFVLWLAFLSVVPLARGVLLGSINIVVIVLAGRLWFRESLGPWRLLGIALIVLGVALVGIDAG
jgi:drug/metabolite transporter (DMT)-like permease